MCSKKLFIAAIILAVVGLNVVQAALWVDNDANDHLWSSEENWSDEAVPTSADDARFSQFNDELKEHPCVIDSTVNAECMTLSGPAFGPDTESWLTITGGSLTIGDYMQVGYGDVGHLEMSGGTLTTAGASTFFGRSTNGDARVDLSGTAFVDLGLGVNNKGTFHGGYGDTCNVELNISENAVLQNASTYWLPYNGTATVNMTGGVLRSTWGRVYLGRQHGGATGVGVFNLSGGLVDMSHDFCVSYDGNGTLNMTGGEIRCGSGFYAPRLAGGTAVANLDGGIINCGFVVVHPGSLIDITEGQIVFPNDGVSYILGLVDDGLITAYGGDPKAEVVAEYNSVANETTVYATILDDGQAWNPNYKGPETLSPDNVRPELTWSSGDFATSHKVYFGTTHEAVFNADENDPEYKGEVTVNSWQVDQDLLLDTGYFWRIDEVDAVNTYKGVIWSFTTSVYLNIEDFDSYVDDAALQAAWSDANIIDTSIVFGGDQAMDVKYSPAVYEFTKTFAAPQDWTQQGVEGLTFWIYGGPANSAEDLYVKLTDNSSATGMAVTNGLPEDLQSDTWVEVNINPADAGIDLQNVTEITIGIGDGSGAAGTGRLRIDEIRLYLPRCVPDLGPVTDFNNDCSVNITDFAMIAAQWLESEKRVTPTAPAVNPRAHYEFEDASGVTVTDSSGNDYHAAIDHASIQWATSFDDSGALDFTSTGYVSVPVEAFNDSNDIETQTSISFWAKGDTIAPEDPLEKRTAFAAGNSPLSFHGCTALFPWNNSYIYWRKGNPDDSWQGTQFLASSEQWSGQWNHYTFTQNADTGEMKVWINGQLMVNTPNKFYPIYGLDLFVIGADHLGNNPYHGLIDDFRIYDTELTVEEIMYLADQPEQVTPLPEEAEPYDIVSDGVIDVEDLKAVASEYASEKLWPDNQ